MKPHRTNLHRCRSFALAFFLLVLSSNSALAQPESLLLATTNHLTLAKSTELTNGLWSFFDSPTTAGLNSVDMLSGADGWAVGGAILHWNGTAWSPVANPAIGGESVVKMISPDDVWAGGDSDILHWNGSQWTTVNKPTWLWLSSASAISTNDVWATAWTIAASQILRIRAPAAGRKAYPAPHAIHGGHWALRRRPGPARYPFRLRPRIGF